MEITRTELQLELFQTTGGKLQEQLTTYIVKDNLSLNCPPHKFWFEATLVSEAEDKIIDLWILPL